MTKPLPTAFAILQSRPEAGGLDPQAPAGARMQASQPSRFARGPVFFRSRFAAAAAITVVLGCLSLDGAPATAQDASLDPHKAALAKNHFERGARLAAQGNDQEAEGEFLETVRIFPDFAEAYIQLGNLSMRRKNFLEGLDRYLQARDALAHLQGAARRQETERRRRIQETMDAIQERIEGLRHSNRATDQGKIDQEMIRLEKLQRELTKGLPAESDPFPAELHFLIGNARMNLERFDEALEDYRQALALKPEYGEVHNNLAVIYLYRKDYARAWEHVHAAEKAGVRVNPQFREELAALAPESPPSPASP